MPIERCWKCHQVKQGVELCPSDDRLCPACYKEDKRLVQKQQTSTTEAATTDSTCPSLLTNDVARYSDAPAAVSDN
jgi:hypothetical protein